MYFSTMCEIDASEMFKDDDRSTDLAFCKSNATFEHKEECEYIFHIGNDGIDGQHVTYMVGQMKNNGCSTEFISAYVEAAKMGATRVMFYV